MTKERFHFDIDDDEGDLVITFSMGECEVASRVRILEGWLLLYLLDPEGFVNDPVATIFCEKCLAHDSNVGLMATEFHTLLSLPRGSITIPRNKEKDFKNGLAQALVEYRDSLDIEWN